MPPKSRPKAKPKTTTKAKPKTTPKAKAKSRPRTTPKKQSKTKASKKRSTVNVNWARKLGITAPGAELSKDLGPLISQNLKPVFQVPPPVGNRRPNEPTLNESWEKAVKKGLRVVKQTNRSGRIIDKIELGKKDLKFENIDVRDLFFTPSWNWKSDEILRVAVQNTPTPAQNFIQVDSKYFKSGRGTHIGIILRGATLSVTVTIMSKKQLRPEPRAPSTRPAKRRRNV